MVYISFMGAFVLQLHDFFFFHSYATHWANNAALWQLMVQWQHLYRNRISLLQAEHNERETFPTVQANYFNKHGWPWRNKDICEYCLRPVINPVRITWWLLPSCSIVWSEPKRKIYHNMAFLICSLLSFSIAVGNGPDGGEWVFALQLLCM